MNTRGDESGAGKRIPTVVTFLEMQGRAPVLAPLPKGKIAILRAERPPVHFYRYLYDTIGRDYHWVDRKKVADDTLETILQDPKVELYVLHAEGCPAGMAELDFRKENVCNLAYFGLMPEFIGCRLGPWLLDAAIDSAFRTEPKRIFVHTCTFDHPKALGLYQRAGFRVYDQRATAFPDPRRTGILPRTLRHPRLPRLPDT